MIDTITLRLPKEATPLSVWGFAVFERSKRPAACEKGTRTTVYSR